MLNKIKQYRYTTVIAVSLIAAFTIGAIISLLIFTGGAATVAAIPFVVIVANTAIGTAAISFVEGALVAIGVSVATAHLAASATIVGGFLTLLAGTFFSLISTSILSILTQVAPKPTAAKNETATLPDDSCRTTRARNTGGNSGKQSRTI